MDLTNEELRERAALIRQMREDPEAIAALLTPGEDNMKDVAEHRANREAIAAA